MELSSKWEIETNNKTKPLNKISLQNNMFVWIYELYFMQSMCNAKQKMELSSIFCFHILKINYST